MSASPRSGREPAEQPGFRFQGVGAGLRVPVGPASDSVCSKPEQVQASEPRRRIRLLLAALFGLTVVVWALEGGYLPDEFRPTLHAVASPETYGVLPAPGIGPRARTAHRRAHPVQEAPPDRGDFAEEEIADLPIAGQADPPAEMQGATPPVRPAQRGRKRGKAATETSAGSLGSEVSLVRASSSGDLSARELREAASTALPRLRACHAAALRHGRVSGTIHARMVVRGPSVESIVIETSISQVSLRSCFRRALTRVSFPANTVDAYSNVKLEIFLRA